MHPEAKVESFVIRFIFADPAADAPDTPGRWYSVVRHVQSDSERHCTDWQDVAAFVAQYVDLEQERTHE